MTPQEVQYVLIGSGVAAVTLAERLLQADPQTHILMLEAGDIYPAKDRRAWWDYVTTGKAVYSPAQDQPNEYHVKSNVDWDCYDNRLIAYGGSTLHWGGWSLRFKPEDFHVCENTGQGADWPFGYATLHDYYYQAEKLLSVCGDDTESWNHLRMEQRNEKREITRPAQPYPLPPFDWTEADGEMITAFRSLGIESGRMPLARYRKCLATGTCKYCPVGARYTAQLALDELTTGPYPHFHVRHRSPVTRILMRNRRTALGVEFLDQEGQKHEVRAERVVVCAGAYESPKLLLQSANDHWPKGLGNAHDLVGSFLVSHSILRVRGEHPRNKECWIQEYDFPTLMSRTYDTPEYQRHGKLLLFKNRKFPNLNFANSMIQGLSKYEIERQLQRSRVIELQAFLEEKGQRENRVTLGEGLTRWKLPTTQVVFDRTESQTADAEARLALLKRVFQEMGYRVTECQIDRPGGHHATGTCRMAVDPKEGVTDANLLVHGTTNLFVCSNAVFPSGSAVNPTLTLTALALRLGDYLKDNAVPAERATAKETAEGTAGILIRPCSNHEDPSMSIPQWVANWGGAVTPPEPPAREAAPLAAHEAPAVASRRPRMTPERARQDLPAMLGDAIRLEFATIPPYLCALWSIKDEVHPVAESMREVVQEEMLHMALTCNLLAAIGGEPHLCDWAPRYPGPLPGEVHTDLEVSLRGLDNEALLGFLRIESPESLPENVDVDASDPRWQGDDTIGQFYECVLAAFRRGKPELSLDRQVSGPLAWRVLADLEDVAWAIHIIQHQGEGAVFGPLDSSKTDLAHYYRFLEIYKRKRLVHDRATDRFVWRGEIEFPKVWPMAQIPEGEYKDPPVEVARRLKAFDLAYSRMLRTLESVWRPNSQGRLGGQGALVRAIDEMFELEKHAKWLLQTKVPGSEMMYGPGFRYVP